MHDIGHDHDHLGHEPDAEEEHPLGKLDIITLTSVGIDVGTATSQILFSRLVLRRLGRELSSRYIVTERQTLFLSDVYLTPYTAGREKIDDRALGVLVDAAYISAGLRAENIDTGAIILTGEAIRRDNARAIADLFASQRGNFVCATAGHNFEALLAAYGSGAVALSLEKQCQILNVDIGGGTTKLALADRGKVLWTGAFHIGARLLARDDAGIIKLLEPGGRVLAQQAGFSWNLGDPVSDPDIDQLAAYMACAILLLARNESVTPELAKLWLTAPPSESTGYDAVMFSGGVGEYVYDREARSFGDLGAPLGRALRREIEANPAAWPLVPARECIRATVMGAAQHTVQVSGNTIHRSNDELLPQKNLQVLRPQVELGDEIDSAVLAGAIQRHFAAFDLEEGKAGVALVFRWDGVPSAMRIAAFCRGLIAGLPRTLELRRPIYLVFDHDLAGLVGTILREEFEITNDILAIDGVTLHDFDFIDLGKVLEPSGTVPVTIKSLVFQF